jgi:hypothetical protein
MNAAFVSCDIIGHSGVKDSKVQFKRVEDINRFVSDVLKDVDEGKVVWASGGDGGHLAFFGDLWAEQCINYIVCLKKWAAEEKVPLRIIGHYGPVDSIKGPGGYIQLVGDGINLAGRLLSFGVSDGVVVSADFKRKFEKYGYKGLVFHHKKVIYPKYFTLMDLYLLSIRDAFISRWSSLLRLERSYTFEREKNLIETALLEKQTWDVVYFAKKMMQLSSQDRQAIDSLEELDIYDYTHRKAISGTSEETEEMVVNSFFKFFNDPEIRTEIIHSSQLIERKRNEIICEFGDAGDSMFIVLRGLVGIFPKGVCPEKELNFVEPVFTAKPGETIGEIAFALKRNRTATLLAIEDTALLAFNVSQINSISRNLHAEDEINEGLNKFLRLSILKFVCGRQPYLVGLDGNGPLSTFKNPWQKLLRYSSLITLPWTQQVFSTKDKELRKRGVYILVRGSILNKANDYLIDSKDNINVLFINDIGHLNTSLDSFTVVEDATILGVDLEGFLLREPGIFRQCITVLEEELKKRPAKKSRVETEMELDYDLFISYRRQGGSELARTLEQALKYKVKVFLDVERLGAGHFDKNLLRTINAAPNFLILLTENSFDRCTSPTDWFRLEIAHAIKASRNIIPITTEGFKIPSSDLLPDELLDIIRFDMIRYDHVYFNSMIERIISRLQPKLNNS